MNQLDPLQSVRKADHQVPAVVKAVSIIRLLNARGATGANLPDISTQLDMSRSHCHNILRTLQELGWLHYDGASRLFTLSALISADTAAGMISEPYIGLIRPILDQFARAVGFGVTAVEPLPDDTYLQILITAHADEHSSVAPPGFRFPKGTPLYFKARWSWMDEASRNAAIERLEPVRFTPYTITGKPELAEELRAARRRGYAKAANEYIEGFASLGLPVFDNKGQVILVISCASRVATLQAHEQELAKALIVCVHECHTVIDGRPPIDFPRP